MNIKSLLLISAILLPSLQAKELDIHLQKLNAANFGEREVAQRFILQALESSSRETRLALFELYWSSPSPEVKSRVRLILKSSETLNIQVVSQKYGVAKGFVGIGMQRGGAVRPVDGKQRGVVVIDSVHPGSPADRHGLKVGDAIWGVDELTFGEDARSAQFKFTEYVAKKRPAEKVLLRVLRGENGHDIPLRLTARYLHLAKAGVYQESKQAREKEQYFDRWLNEKLKE